MIQNISFNRSFYNNFSNKHFQSPSFGTTNRIYETENGDTIGCNSWLFRNDIVSKKIAAKTPTKTPAKINKQNQKEKKSFHINISK